MSLPNRLIHESSPYLLQHAHNPVDWYPWGEAALKKAEDENKPILVSIGYSSCHWCHVMELESFENIEIARLMNENFVCIKVDREERPDVDAVYMDAVQAMGIRGGWPLNVFLLPDARPFYGLTYLPPANWAKLLQQIHTAYSQNQSELERSAAGFVTHLNASESEKYGLSVFREGLSLDELDTIFGRFSSHFDKEKGGMDRAPKFPMPSVYKFLLRYFDATQHPEALRQIELSLHRMALGGIFDHVGGGWARYSVDDEWFIPHFEKMLYDNGQLLSVYSEAYALTGHPLYLDRIRKTIKWLESELLSEEGGFYSALDADSEGEEGKFYTWTKEELEAVLEDDFVWFAAIYDISEEGNWEAGRNHLHLTTLPAYIAKEKGLEIAGFETRYEAALQKLVLARSARVRPGLDDKILASWNGLALKGLADAYRATGEEQWRNLALRNAEFIKDKLLDGDRLFHTYKAGSARIPGFLEDYAAVAEAFAAVYQLTFDESWLSLSRRLLDYAIGHFFDQDEGFFRFTDKDSESLIARKTELFDNVIPASNSAMGHALYVTGKLLDHDGYLRIAGQMASKMIKLISTDVQWVTNWAALHCVLATSTAEIVIAGPEADSWRKDLDRFFIPNKIVMKAFPGSSLPLTAGKAPLQGKTTIYVCFDKTCQLPVHSVEEALRQIETS